MNRKEAAKKIENYFKSRYVPVYDKSKNLVYDEKGEIIYEPNRPMTLSGLALALGLDEREKLQTFTKNKMILYDVRCAILKIEEYAEERLFSKEYNTAGIKLYLGTNFKRWTDEIAQGEDEDLPEQFSKWAE